MSNEGLLCYSVGVKAVHFLHFSGSLLSGEKVNNVKKTQDNVFNISSWTNSSHQDVKTGVFITTSGSLRRGALTGVPLVSLTEGQRTKDV